MNSPAQPDPPTTERRSGINSTIRGLAGQLISAGILTPDQAREAVQEAKAQRVSLIRYLIDTLDVGSKELAEMASAEFGQPVFDLNAMNREMLPDNNIDAELMIKHHAVPLFQRGNRLFVAISDPMNLGALDEFKFATRYQHRRSHGRGPRPQ